VIVAPRTDSDSAARLAERIRSEIGKRPFDLGDRSIDVTVSIGCAAGVETYSELVDRADKALYRSKTEGRNRVTTA
jgi:diguanylate cyclase (GGDEF)-like protein